MNERIRELAEQAGITTNLDTDYFEKDVNKWVDYYSEKFALLIVQECAGIYSKIDNGNLHMGTDDYLEALHKTFRS
jgi:hypothetical protein